MPMLNLKKSITFDCNAKKNGDELAKFRGIYSQIVADFPEWYVFM